MKRLSFLCVSILTLIHGKALGEDNKNVPECVVNGIESAKYGWMPQVKDGVISLRKKIDGTDDEIVFSAPSPASSVQPKTKILVLDASNPSDISYPERITVKLGKEVLCYGDDRAENGEKKTPECIFGVTNSLIYDDEDNNSNKSAPTTGSVHLDLYDGMENRHLLLDMAEINKALSEVSDEVDKMAQLESKGKCKNSSKNGCYITTAVCEHVELPDDCFELTQLRRFRDRYLLSFDGGINDVARYYELAPLINQHLSPEKYTGLYWKYILPCAISALLGMNKFTHARYRKMVSELVSIISISTIPVTL